MEITYQDKVYDMILKMEMGEVFVTAEKVAPDNREKFINIVKSFIDADNGRHLGFYMTFSNDYSKIKKRSL